MPAYATTASIHNVNGAKTTLLNPETWHRKRRAIDENCIPSVYDITPSQKKQYWQVLASGFALNSVPPFWANWAAVWRHSRHAVNGAGAIAPGGPPPQDCQIGNNGLNLFRKSALAPRASHPDQTRPASLLQGETKILEKDLASMVVFISKKLPACTKLLMLWLYQY